MQGTFLFILLVAFWAILSGQVGDPFLMSVGVLTALGIAVLLRHLDLLITSWSPLRLLKAAVTYAPWLAWQVLVANLKVTYAVWHPSLPIAPRTVRVPVSLTTPLGHVVYANSITLTPGTVTVVTGEDEYVVHALTAADATTLAGGEMHERIERLEPSS